MARTVDDSNYRTSPSIGFIPITTTQFGRTTDSQHYRTSPGAVSNPILTSGVTPSTLPTTRPYDVAVDQWGWDPAKLYADRQMYGYTWLPNANGPATGSMGADIEMAPGLSSPVWKQYDPNKPAAGSFAAAPWMQYGMSLEDWYKLPTVGGPGGEGGQNTIFTAPGAPGQNPGQVAGNQGQQSQPQAFLSPPQVAAPGAASPAAGSGGEAGLPSASTPNLQLLQLLSGVGGVNPADYLTSFAQFGGKPTAVGPAWEAMVAAQKRNLDQKFANLTEGFGVSGNRFSTSFGNAATDFWNQAGLDQNALLGQMWTGSQEAARGRELSAAGQISQEDLQQWLQQNQQGLQAAMAMFGQGSGNQLSAATTLAQLAGQGAMGLQAGALQGAQGLFGAENNASMAELARQLQLQGMDLSNASNLSQLWQSNLGLGSALGGQQYQTLQNEVDKAYQEWIRTQPMYNPLLSMMFQGATGYPPSYMPQYPQSNLGGILGGVGGVLGGLPAFLKMLGLGD